jgi:drug/metabolite transporter (DMT)-like permease
MRCHWTFQIESLLAVAVVLVAGALWGVRHAEARRVVGGVLILFGLLVVAVTQSWVVGLCGNAAMACHETAHWLWLWSVLLVAVGGFVAVSARTRTEKALVSDPWEDPGSPGEAA